MSLKEQEGALSHREISPTAATVGNKLYGPSGVMRYTVVVAQTGGARSGCVVEAATGDEAAEKALEKFPGWKVAYVGPATDPVPTLSDEAA